MEIIVYYEKYGKEYVCALKDVLDVREQRRKVYGDTFLDDDIQFLKYQLENKLKRLTAQIESGELKETKENTETAIDSLIDIVNYAIFLLVKIKRGDKK